jgi:uncharacterized protein YjiK
MPVFKKTFHLFLVSSFLFISCKDKAPFRSPVGYDINKPEKFVLGKSLNEISGITFIEGKKDTLFAIEDETGKLFSIAWGNDNSSHSKFAKKGDFEDVAILNTNTVSVLRSDGSFFLFPVAEIGKEKIDSVHEYDNILPEGEYEGLSGVDGKLFALCKNCLGDNEKTEVSVYILEQDSTKLLKVKGSSKIDLSTIRPEDIKGKGKGKFHPSCMAKNPVTHDWVIISAVNKLLLVLDEQWKVKDSYPLDPSLFNQPEGLTFNANGDMYISNEGGGGSATILLFRYHKPQ